MKAIEVLDIVPEVSLDEIKYRKIVEVRGRISRDTITEISRSKNEPEWMLRLRLRALELFKKLPMPKWLMGIDYIDLDEISYYSRPDIPRVSSWEELPEDIRRVYEKLGLPEAYAKYLAGIATTLDSETIYSSTKDFLKKLGVIMVPMEEAIKKYPDLVKKYFGKVFPYSDHKFAALHYALWSGGVFVYVPPGVRVLYPIEAFFLVGDALEGQFEHTLIVVDEGAEITFIEGCSAPKLKNYSFHNGMVEVYAHRNSSVKFITVQNWSKDVINFNNKRAIAEENAYVEWIEGSIGSKITVTYPSTILKGRNSRTYSIVVGIAKGPYIKDTGSKVYHLAPNTSSRIVSKSISANGGINIYRGLVKINKGARKSKSFVQCDSLILDEYSKAYTYPHVQVEEDTASIGHEATTGRLSEKQLFYLQSRGLSEEEAKSIVVIGFIRDILKDLPLEYVTMLGKVIQLEFSSLGGVG